MKILDLSVHRLTLTFDLFPLPHILVLKQELKKQELKKQELKKQELKKQKLMRELKRESKHLEGIHFEEEEESDPMPCRGLFLEPYLILCRFLSSKRN